MGDGAGAEEAVEGQQAGARTARAFFSPRGGQHLCRRTLVCIVCVVIANVYSQRGKI